MCKNVVYVQLWVSTPVGTLLLAISCYDILPTYMQIECQH